MSQARELNVFVHACQGIRRPPMEVALILHIDGAGVGANVCHNCVFPSSSSLVLLPAPFQGEVIFEAERLLEDLVFEL